MSEAVSRDAEEDYAATALNCIINISLNRWRMADQRHHFLVTDVKLCKEAWHHKWSNTLVYELQTEVGQLALELTSDAAKKLRKLTKAPKARRVTVRS